jgi:flagellar protein FlgJ
MAINPGADLLTDALAAADPQRAKAAEERLARLAVQPAGDISAAPEFQEVLASESPSLKSPGAISAAFPGAAHSVKSGNPYEQFEVTVLKSLFEFMLPAKATSVFGSGFAGEVWKSMLADSLADVAGKAGIAGIARTLEARKQNGGPGSRSKSS